MGSGWAQKVCDPSTACHRGGLFYLGLPKYVITREHYKRHREQRPDRLFGPLITHTHAHMWHMWAVVGHYRMRMGIRRTKGVCVCPNYICCFCDRYDVACQISAERRLCVGSRQLMSPRLATRSAPQPTRKLRYLLKPQYVLSIRTLHKKKQQPHMFVVYARARELIYSKS